MALQILIVDADTSAATMTGALVQHVLPTAMVVWEAAPEQAWIAAQHAPPDVLIIDPGSYSLGSVLFVRLCKETWPAVRVVALASDRVAASRVRQSYADVYLEKPTSPERLVETFEKVLQPANGGVHGPDGQ